MSIEDRINVLSREVADGMGLELVDVELLGTGRRTLLRITIDRPGGVTVEDCERFSKDIGAVLDVENFMQSAYTLEVSSPGLDRPLKDARDFGRHEGERVRVEVKDKVEGRGSWTGTVMEILPDRTRLSCDGKEVEIMYENILKARLEIEIK